MNRWWTTVPQAVAGWRRPDPDLDRARLQSVRVLLWALAGLSTVLGGAVVCLTDPIAGTIRATCGGLLLVAMVAAARSARLGARIAIVMYIVLGLLCLGLAGAAPTNNLAPLLQLHWAVLMAVTVTETRRRAFQIATPFVIVLLGVPFRDGFSRAAFDTSISVLSVDVALLTLIHLGSTFWHATAGSINAERLRTDQMNAELSRTAAELEQRVEHRLSDLRESEAELTQGADALRSSLETAAALSQRLEALASNDELTGLSNRRTFNDALDVAVEEGTVALVMLDVDHFKRINDGHGHLVGDQVLVQVAQTLQRHCMPGWVAARIGGEEFALVMPGTDHDLAHRHAQQIVDEVRGLDWSRIGPGQVTVSAGVAAGAVNAFGQAPKDRAARVFGAADAALYRAKRSGRDQVSSAAEVMQ